MDTVIRQASLNDKAAIWNFLKAAYGESIKYKVPERWNWEFIENPMADKMNKKIPVFLAIKKGHIVGQLCAILSNIKIGNEMYSSVAGCDLIVLPEHRKEGLAQRLIEAVSNHYKIYLAISYAETTKRIYEKMKPIVLESIPTYFKFQRMMPEAVFYYLMQKTSRRIWLKNIVEKGCMLGADKIISMTINSFIRTKDFLNWKEKRLKSNIEEINYFDERIDDLWNRINKKFKVVIKRDKEFLNWRFSHCPQLDYRKFICMQDGIITGYIVIRRPSSNELKIGIIADIFADPEEKDTINDLIAYSIQFFNKTVIMIECPTTQQEYQTILSKSGFIKMKKNIPIVFCKNAMLKSKLEDWKNSWFITKADEDWDQLHPIIDYKK